MRLTFRASRRLHVAAALIPAAVCLSATRALAGGASQASPTAAATAPAAGAVTVHATWDSRYVYFAFQVPDSDITGTNTRPLSHPEQDDSVSVYFEAGTAKSATPDAATHAMLVSVAQGFTLLDGSPRGTLAVAAKPDFTIKYGVALDGTLNRSDDKDNGYTITLAVPLALLGLDAATAKPGVSVGFNAVVRSRSAHSFTSLSPDVKTDTDIASPAKWTRLTLLSPTGTGGAGTEGINAPEVDPKGSPPLIDGTYRTLDWPVASKSAFASPDSLRVAATVPTPITPAAPRTDFAAADATLPPLDLTAPITDMQRLVMARYVPTYQADRRKVNVPTRGVFAQDGTVLLTDQPATGVGPWFSSDRVGYHRTELAEMRRAGIDVALVQIGGPDGPDAAMDEKDVLTLVTALRELAAAHIQAPQIALCLDTPRLSASAGGTDFGANAGRDVLYAAIRRWFRLVPPEFRARVLVPLRSGAITPAYPLFLLRGDAVVNLADPDWSTAIRTRFASEFGPATGGTTLLFAGIGGAWSAAGANVAAVIPTANGSGTGAVKTFFLAPGLAVPGVPVVGRRGGTTYHDAWEAAIAAQPAWFVIDSWNDFNVASDITASRQYGPQYADITRIYAIQTSGLKDQDVRWLDEDAPRRMSPGQVVNTTVTLQNTGMAVLRGEDGYGLAYRWRQNGKVVAEGPLVLPLARPLLPSLSGSLPVGLAAAQIDAAGHFAPLAPGDYTVEIGLVKTSPDRKTTTYLSDVADPATKIAPLLIPVTVTSDLPDYVQFSSTTTPLIVRGGETVPTAVRLRWMGTQPLAATDASLVYQIMSDDGKVTVATGTIPLGQPLPPGQWVSQPATIRFSAVGDPVPPANPEARLLSADPNKPAGYRIRYLLTRTNSVESIPGQYDEPVAVYAPDDSADVLVPASPPTSFDAGARVGVSIRVLNRGATTWTGGAYSVGYHWYDADGQETDWKPLVSTPIPGDVKPGEGAIVPVDIRVPDHEGDFVLAIDVIRNADQTFLSTLAGTRSPGIGLLPIRVRGGERLQFVDLTPAFNSDAVASDARPADGDIDGKGDTLPAESFPPDRFGIVALVSPPTEKARPGKPAAPDLTAYPSGYYVTAEPNQQQISFRYGPDSDGAKNAVTCTGQNIPTPHGRFLGLHVAATATGGMSAPLSLVLHFRDGTTKTVSSTVPDWKAVAGPTDAPAIAIHLERTPAGDQVSSCTVWHIIYAIDVSKELESITLPNSSDVKIFAMTLEKG